MSQIAGNINESSPTNFVLETSKNVSNSTCTDNLSNGDKSSYWYWLLAVLFFIILSVIIDCIRSRRDYFHSVEYSSFYLKRMPDIIEKQIVTKVRMHYASFKKI